MTDHVPPCPRVTGYAFEPHYSTLDTVRQGPRRPQDAVNPSKRGCFSSAPPEAVYDVLCGAPSTYVLWNDVYQTHSCGRCLTSQMDQTLAGQLTVHVRATRGIAS